MKTIGRTIALSFPEIALRSIPAKVDTGAYTSSVHCSKIEKLEGNRISCIFLDPSHTAYTGKEHEFEIIREVRVKSSNGTPEKRYMIKTSAEHEGTQFHIFLTLTNRGGMRYPVLLGRKFLRGKFIVDVSLKA